MIIDIFIPYWGDPEYMMQSLQSVLRQDDDRWKLTIVDDAFPDPTIQNHVRQLNHPQVTYIRKHSNEGITANFRTCVQLASRELVVILGCDDVLLPNYVRTVLSAYERFPAADIIQPGVQTIDENNMITAGLADKVKKVLRPSRTDRLLEGEPLATSLMHGVWLYWPSLAFKTSAIKKVDFRDEFLVIQDVALTMDMIFGGARLLIEPTVCFSYRRHSQSASSVKLVDGSRFQGERDYFSLAAKLASSMGWKRTRRAACWRLTSRLHAAVLIPRALTSGSLTAFNTLLRHLVGP